MDFEQHPFNQMSPAVYLHLYNNMLNIRAYSFFTIDPTQFLTTKIITRSLQHYYPLNHPFTWYVYRNLAIIVNANDIQQQQPQFMYRAYDQTPPCVHVEPADADVVLNQFGNHQISNDFRQFKKSRRLTETVIMKNLKVTNYSKKEDEEICAICQVEMENKEKVGELECEHQFHPNCIKKWLVRKNVCPLCKAQGLKV